MASDFSRQQWELKDNGEISEGKWFPIDKSMPQTNN